jgi:uncharacterized protein (DUF488 family)
MSNIIPDEDSRVTVYSIGHSNHSIETFLAILDRHGITSLVDVRSAPYSRYVPHFNRPELEDAVERHKIRYVFLGDELGGRPPGDQFYDDEGYVLYYRAATADFFLHGLDKLVEEAGVYRAAMMCSEEDPTNCHRRLLIARVLEKQGVQVVHLRADGREQTEDDWKLEPTLWDAVDTIEPEETEWKSIRPVSRRRQPSSSSSHSDEWESDGY